jgi:prevent-host-death family protein
MATSSYFSEMSTVSIKDAKNRLTALARQVETKGERVVITRNGKPVADLVPHKPSKGLNPAGYAAFLKRNGIKNTVLYVAPDFDDPLPEDFLLKPLSTKPRRPERRAK